jgi:hypothetical protein
MAKKIVVKTGKRGKGSVPRSAIRKAVETVFGAASRAVNPAQSARATGTQRTKNGALAH